MGNLYPLSRPGKPHAVLANNISSPHRGKSNLPSLPRAGTSVARKHSVMIKTAAQSRSDDFAHFQSGSRRCIDLIAVMRFNNLDIDIIAKSPGRDLKQLKANVDADTHIRGKHDRSITRCL